MRLIIEPTYDAVSRWAANYVCIGASISSSRQRINLSYWVFPQGRRLWACINI